MGPATQDLWRVLLASGETSMTLDALDEAFHAERIDASTMVLEPGGIFWRPLGEVAGLDEPRGAADVQANVALDIDVDVDVGELTRAPRWKRHALLAVPISVGVIAVIAWASSAVSGGAAESSIDGRVAASHLAPVTPPAPVTPVTPSAPVASVASSASARPPNGPILVPFKHASTPAEKPKTKRASKR